MKRPAITAGIVLAIASSAATAQTVQKFSASKANEYGLTYSLPVTVLDITIETETTVCKPGEFYKYARRYFNINDPITTESTRVEVKSITVDTHGESDPNERYIVSFKPGYTPFMMIGSDGIPLAINTENTFSPEKASIPEPVAAQPTPLETPAARQAMSEEIMQSQSTAKRAELAAAQIFALRQSRNDLITGQADQMPPDGKSMELILNNINAQEAALMAMFIGTTQTSTDVVTLTYTPQGDTDSESRRVLARVSSISGVVPADDLSGAPIYLTINVSDRPTMPVDPKGKTIEIPRDAFIYTMPGKVDIDIEYKGQSLAQTTVEMSQFGIRYGLKPNTFTDKKAPAYAVFDPSTGAIVELGTVQ
ncbi:MAG: DUF4831 family protein [Muribaculaceae bacterium]|nr:DUF4831 family protein [Muribaculaceae bacterium]